MEIQLFEIDGGYGFQIVREGIVCYYQPTDTDGSNQPMTEGRALELANEILQRL